MIRIICAMMLVAASMVCAQEQQPNVAKPATVVVPKIVGERFEWAVCNEQGERLYFGIQNASSLIESFAISTGCIQQLTMDGKIKPNIKVWLWVSWQKRWYSDCIRTGDRLHDYGCGGGVAWVPNNNGDTVVIENCVSSSSGSSSGASSSSEAVNSNSNSASAQNQNSNTVQNQNTNNNVNANNNQNDNKNNNTNSNQNANANANNNNNQNSNANQNNNSNTATGGDSGSGGTVNCPAPTPPTCDNGNRGDCNSNKGNDCNNKGNDCNKGNNGKCNNGRKTNCTPKKTDCKSGR